MQQKGPPQRAFASIRSAYSIFVGGLKPSLSIQDLTSTDCIGSILSQRRHRHTRDALSPRQSITLGLPQFGQGLRRAPVIGRCPPPLDNGGAWEQASTNMRQNRESFFGSRPALAHPGHPSLPPRRRSLHCAGLRYSQCRHLGTGGVLRLLATWEPIMAKAEQERLQCSQ